MNNKGLKYTRYGTVYDAVPQADGTVGYRVKVDGQPWPFLAYDVEGCKAVPMGAAIVISWRPEDESRVFFAWGGVDRNAGVAQYKPGTVLDLGPASTYTTRDKVTILEEAADVTVIGGEFRVMAVSPPKVEAVDLRPSSLNVRTGSLEITTTGPGLYKHGGQVEIKLDGKPIRCRKLTLFVAVNEVVRAEMEILP